MSYSEEMKDFSKHLERYCYIKSEGQQFIDFLDYVIYGFCINAKDSPISSWDKDYLKHIHKALQLFTLAMQKALEKNEWVDLLGYYYETISSDSKKSNFGQFFTPECICVFMAMCLESQSQEKVCDPCCGSGRLLLAGYFSTKKYPRLFGKDCDYVCARMCLVNFFFHGCIGSEVVHGDSLINSFIKGWRIEFNPNHNFLCVVEIDEKESVIQRSLSREEKPIEKTEAEQLIQRTETSSPSTSSYIQSQIIETKEQSPEDKKQKILLEIKEQLNLL